MVLAFRYRQSSLSSFTVRDLHEVPLNLLNWVDNHQSTLFMIKFFRKIREQLLVENKTGRYFKYAIGEIILVVIGILIALQINNWNEERKNSIKEKQFLTSFKNDLLTNINELERVIEKSEFTSMNADSVIRIHKNTIQDVPLYKLIGQIMAGTGFTVYTSREGTMKDILGSGSLDIIKNDSIRLAIGSWEGNLKILREWEKIDKKSSDTYVEFLMANLDLYKDDPLLVLTEERKEFLFKNRVFLNHLTDRKYIPLTLNEEYKNELKRLKSLVNSIENEL